MSGFCKAFHWAVELGCRGVPLQQQVKVDKHLTSNCAGYSRERFVPIRKWSIQYLVMLLLLFTLFSAVQYLKGRELAYAIEFGVLWAWISSTIFLVVRIRNYRNRVDCQLCNDLRDK